ncbi:uncharacterized protein K02A2.6-like [Ylistrum balloti]|uniref:uncharacterized protein K02A2.6-like n=1 Tax=Ylistrum balloti TaxID=509963 RepID=UPI00290589F5|nr:uncharacterized protein K02A2.6-like [Ylistrum balloti]
MELDTGSGVTVVTEEVYKGHLKSRPLFDSEWLREITLDCSNMYHERTQVDSKSNICSSVQQMLEPIMDAHPSIFKDDWGSHPKFCKARTVPYAIKPKVDEELDRLVSAGTLPKIIYTEWGTPIVPVIKRDDSVRLCGDFKVTLNPMLEVDQYPLLRTADIFASFADGQRFSKLDLQHAYLQMEVEEDSKDLLTINTEKGLYKFNRLIYAIASAPAIWQRAMDTVLQGLQGVQCIIDEMLITGKQMRNIYKIWKRFSSG